MIAHAAPLALLAGAAAGLMQLAGALKTAPPLAALPFDLTLAALALLLPLLALLAATRRWELDPRLALPLAAAALLAFWLVVAGSWTASRSVAADKLPEVVLAAPLMLAAGLVVGAEPAARAALVGVSLLVGAALALLVAAGFGQSGVLALLADAERARVHHQHAGLAMAIAAGLAAVRAAEARHAATALAWLALVALLAASSLLPGGRTALLALAAGVALAPALRLWLGGRRAVALAWLAAMLTAGLVFILLLALDPVRAEGLRTLERLATGSAGLDARRLLWGAALDWAGATAPLGLGTGGFTIAAGTGDRRSLHPHNHAMEALAEAGLPGFLLWLVAFGGGALAALGLARRAGPAAAARIAAMVLPVALTAMVSTDLGNRMVWFALGLALSLGVAARPAVPRHV